MMIMLLKFHVPSKIKSDIIIITDLIINVKKMVDRFLMILIVSITRTL